ncbi:hypothetical protein [Thermococcus sp. GR6]|uniref:hypothetical protein n=1 Tax=Thermococcus sp. GR6 TaxID=1638256 RepID=UPI00142FF73C|nr:hypothetical protein [Thermococcus sp. GR6]NJE41806.1 hypothetical protein [Thermococcus sp. GR6]
MKLLVVKKVESLGKVPLKWKLTTLLLGITTALMALFAVYTITGGNFDDNGITGAVAGISAAQLIRPTIEKLKKHIFKTYVSLVFLNTLLTALIVNHFNLQPEGTLQFMGAFIVVYIPLSVFDYSLIKAVGRISENRQNGGAE